jgi:V/A-type H+-transporting ATPase subunit I
MANVEALRGREAAAAAERKKIEDALVEARAFSNLNAPYADLERLSYLTLRVGRIDPSRVDAVRESLGDRAALIPLGTDGRVVAAASRKGRFALDTELGKAAFVPIAIPEDFTGVPAEVLAGLERRLQEADREIARIAEEKGQFALRTAPQIRRLADSFRMAAAVDRLKAGLESTRSAYRLKGWIAAEKVADTVSDLERIADGRVAVRSYDPEEVSSVQEGSEKVPVSLDHGRFVGGFQRVVFSYGAPLYGTIDPTPFVAVSFTVLFGLMFGDVGQGLVLLLLGILTGRMKSGFLARFSRFFRRPDGSRRLVHGRRFPGRGSFLQRSDPGAAYRAVTGFLTGVPVDRVLHLMPEKGHLDKLFMFFGFTVAVGVVINSVGLAINIVNQVPCGAGKSPVRQNRSGGGSPVLVCPLPGGAGDHGRFPRMVRRFRPRTSRGGPFLRSRPVALATGERPVLEHG